MSDRDLYPLMNRFAVAIDGRGWLNLPSARQALWRRAATVALRATEVTNSLLRVKHDKLVERLEELAEGWEELASHQHGEELVCHLCIAYKAAATEVRRALASNR